MPHRAHIGSRRDAFTLIEVMVVCAILAVIAGVVATSLNGRIRETQLTQANDQIESVDRVARSLARNNGVGAKLEFDGSENEIRVKVGRGTHKIVRLPAAVTLSGIRVGKATARRDGELAVSPLGQSLTYAVELTVGKKSRWVVVSGVSGQAFGTRKTEQVDALLRL